MSEPQANMHILFILVDIHQPIHVLTSVNIKTDRIFEKKYNASRCDF